MCRTLICCILGAAYMHNESFAGWSTAKRTPPNTSRNNNSNTQRTENKTTDVVIHQHSRKLLKMDILMSETCWAKNKWNKIASDIKLVFHSSTRKRLFPYKALSCWLYNRDENCLIFVFKWLLFFIKPNLCSKFHIKFRQELVCRVYFH